MRGIFVTGTDTGVGKTAVCAALMVRYRGARYWKPIQTGPDDDTAEVLCLSSSPPEAAYLHGVRLADPVSPHLAARRAGTRIDLPFLTAEMKKSADPWIVEGAGGALVPVNESDLMVHLMERLGLPVVVAARTTLGTINHTLLTIEAVRARRLAVAGVVLVGDLDAGNRAAIEEYGNVPILGEMPRFDEYARTTEPSSAGNLRVAGNLEGRAGPVRAEENARTTEPGSAEGSRVSGRLEGRAGPVRAEENARTTEPGSAEGSRVPGRLEGRAGPVRAEENARTTEPGSAEGSRVPGRLEGRASPVRAEENARTTELGSAERSRVPGNLEGRAGPVRALDPADLAAWAAAHLDSESRLAEFLA